MRTILLIPVCCLCLFCACTSSNEQELEQRVAEQGTILGSQRQVLDTLSGQFNVILKNLEATQLKESYLKDINFSNPKDLSDALSSLEKALNASIQEIEDSKLSKDEAVKKLSAELNTVQLELEKRKFELQQYKDLLATRPDAPAPRPPAPPDYDLMVNSLQAQLRNKEKELKTVKKDNTTKSKEITTLKTEIAGLELQKDNLTAAIAHAESLLAKLERQKEEVSRKYEQEKKSLETKLEKEKAMAYLSIARGMAEELENVKKTKGRRDDFCKKVCVYYEKVFECNCDIAAKAKGEYENFKRQCD